MSARDTTADAALDALAVALAPRILKLLREQTGAADDDLAELLGAAGYELDAVSPAMANDGRKGAA